MGSSQPLFYADVNARAAMNLERAPARTAHARLNVREQARSSTQCIFCRGKENEIGVQRRQKKVEIFVKEKKNKLSHRHKSNQEPKMAGERSQPGNTEKGPAPSELRGGVFEI